MTDQRTDPAIDTSLDDRVARALADGPAGLDVVDVRDPAAPRRRFGVRMEQDQERERRVAQHELRLDALTQRLSGLALRTAALQAAQEGALDARRDLTALADELTARVDSVVIDQMEAHSAHELTVKLVRDVIARLEEAEARHLADRAATDARLDELTDAVAALTTKTRTQAGQITKLRNQVKAVTEAPAGASPPTPEKRASTSATKRAAAPAKTASAATKRPAKRPTKRSRST